MTHLMLFNDKTLRARIIKVHAAMRTRAKPKLWKSGKRAGTVRRQGLDGLPFTGEALWQFALKHVGVGAVRCSYCMDIGRPANIIDLANVVFDHVVPVSRGGSWGLDNLRCVCADCNGLKGEMSYEFFVMIMRVLYEPSATEDRAYVIKCLRTHGTSMRLRFGPKKKGEIATLPAPSPELFAEDF